MLMEPVIAQIGGVLLKQDNIPGIYTFIGGSMITTAFFMAGYGEKLKDQQNQQRRLKQTEQFEKESEMSIL